MSSEFAVRAIGLGKTYQIYPTPRDRLKQFLLPRVRKLLGLAPKQYYQDFSALQDVSFEIRRGETFGIIGRNGSGKSTLLQILCGTLTPTAGTVEVNGRVAALLELGAGFNPEFTGRENVFMNARVLGLSEEKIVERFESIVAFSEIAEFIDRPVKTYSSGMYVRLAFAVIAHVDADILVIDEALSVGDAFFVQKCMRFLRDFMEHGTLLFVSHDTGSVLNLCSRAMLLKQGRPVCLDTPKAVVQQYLEGLVEANQGAIVVEAGEVTAEPLAASADYRDMRQDLRNESSLRNEVEVFRFNDRSSAFGTGLATIGDVRLLNPDGQPLLWVLGGESVSLRIRCVAKTDIVSPIVGFTAARPDRATAVRRQYLPDPSRRGADARRRPFDRGELRVQTAAAAARRLFLLRRRGRRNAGEPCAASLDARRVDHPGPHGLRRARSRRHPDAQDRIAGAGGMTAPPWRTPC